MPKNGKKSDLSAALGKIEKTLELERKREASLRTRAENMEKHLFERDEQLKAAKLKIKELEEVRMKEITEEHAAEIKTLTDDLKRKHDETKEKLEEELRTFQKRSEEWKSAVMDTETRMKDLENETKENVTKLVKKIEAKNDLIHRARIRVAKLEAERNVHEKKNR